MKMCLRVWTFCVATGPLAATIAVAESAPAPEKRNVEGIMDNSFLVEEAFNQEAGVVQHIFTSFYSVDKLGGPDQHAVNLSFTQEWPMLSQTHQVSYTIPYTFQRRGGPWTDGVGDVLLNYRLQAYYSEKHLRAFAPRVSLVLPTGDSRKGLGEDAVGGQFNLPFSTAVGRRWFLHSNAGLTWLPHAASAGRRDLLHFNLGQSLIYAPTENFNLMLEWVGYWNEGPDSGGRLERKFVPLLAPGFRKAFNFADDSQLVLGLAAPIGLTRSAPDYGVFFYLSFEHRLWGKK